MEQDIKMGSWISKMYSVPSKIYIFKILVFRYTLKETAANRTHLYNRILSRLYRYVVCCLCPILISTLLSRNILTALKLVWNKIDTGTYTKVFWNCCTCWMRLDHSYSRVRISIIVKSCESICGFTHFSQHCYVLQASWVLNPKQKQLHLKLNLYSAAIKHITRVGKYILFMQLLSSCNQYLFQSDDDILAHVAKAFRICRLDL